MDTPGFLDQVADVLSPRKNWQRLEDTVHETVKSVKGGVTNAVNRAGEVAYDTKESVGKFVDKAADYRAYSGKR
jgi:hypothetical protein